MNIIHNNITSKWLILPKQINHVPLDQLQGALVFTVLSTYITTLLETLANTLPRRPVDGFASAERVYPA